MKTATTVNWFSTSTCNQLSQGDMNSNLGKCRTHFRDAWSSCRRPILAFYIVPSRDWPPTGQGVKKFDVGVGADVVLASTLMTHMNWEIRRDSTKALRLPTITESRTLGEFGQAIAVILMHSESTHAIAVVSIRLTGAAVGVIACARYAAQILRVLDMAWCEDE
jgi:hypothetical protein